jgi:argininosuccinate synthase
LSEEPSNKQYHAVPISDSKGDPTQQDHSDYIEVAEHFALFQQLSKHVSDQIYDGRWFDPSTQAARAAIQVWADKATAEVTLGLYKGNIFFESLTGLEATIYNEADSSMEASDGLNPHSSQGFAEIQSVEAKMLAKAGQVKA